MRQRCPPFAGQNNYPVKGVFYRAKQSCSLYLKAKSILVKICKKKERPGDRVFPGENE